MLKNSIFGLAVVSLLIFNTTAEAGDRVLYSHLTNGSWQIWSMNPDGTDQQQVTSSVADKRDPVAVRNGKGIAFRTNNGQLFVVDVATRQEQEFLAKFRNISNPNYCNKTDEVIFAHFDPQGNDASNIWKSDLEGAKALLLTKNSVLKYQPAFSWQCDKIVFVKANGKMESHHLWIMDADGGNPSQLTQDKGLFTLPAFSPDGKLLTLTSNYQDNNYEIYTLDLATLKLKRITRSPGLDTYSRFSPDGSKLIFVSNRSGNQQIWIMDIDGTNVKQLTFGEDESVSPSWGILQ